MTMMNHHCCGFFIFVAVLIGLPLPATSADETVHTAFSDVVVEETSVPMRDGVHLHTLIYRPASGGPFPAIGVRTPYEVPTGTPWTKDEGLSFEQKLARWKDFIAAGYTIVWQQARGRSKSEGVDLYLDSARDDGFDFVEWIARQPWSNGRVGLSGSSANAALALHAAAARPPALKAVFAQVGCANAYEHRLRERFGGTALESILLWHLSQIQGLGQDHLRYAIEQLRVPEEKIPELFARAKELQERLLAESDRPAASAAWMHRPIVEYPVVSELVPGWKSYFDDILHAERAKKYDVIENIAVPVYRVGTWHDGYADCTVQEFARLQKVHKDGRLLMMPGTHYQIYEEQRWPFIPFKDWMDHHLKGIRNSIDGSPAVQYRPAQQESELTGNAPLLAAETWPPKASMLITTYLDTGGHIVSEAPRVDKVIGTLVSNPDDPVPAIGGRNIIVRAGALDQRPLSSRKDVLSFTSGALPAPLLMTGPVELSLGVACNRVDCDYIARLIDVAPDGTQSVVSEGRVRLRYRDGVEKASLAAPGTVYRVSIQVGQVAYRFGSDHRVAIHLSGSLFPRFDINTHTATSSYQSTAALVATSTLVSSAREPARLTYRQLQGRL